MAKADEESKSDGLEIISVGSLYSGPWDKKYWSSSRGKDRYPYPVGYQALRNHKGLTYKMEIYEGPKGPVFQITSNNKQSSSGDTPDRAWESFQKKYSSRVKLWHGKRFSGKVDGVEFFGFKNALVQRLLRELVASVNDASEQSSLCNKFNEASANNPDTGCTLIVKCPDLMPYLEKNRITGKRSRPCRGVEMSSAGKGSIGRCQPEQGDDDVKVLCSKSCKTSDELMASCSSGDNNEISNASGALLLSSEMDLVKSAHAFEACNDSKVEPCLEEVPWEPKKETCTSASLVNFNIHEEEKPLDRHSVEVQGHDYPVTTQDKNEKAQGLGDSIDPNPPVLNDSQADNCGDLCAPDTLDAQQEITSGPDSGNHHRKKISTGGNEPAAADAIMSEEPISGSHSEDGNSYLIGNYERSDFDSIGEEIAKSMMTVLLPQAVPLLTYSSRKKRRRPKPSEVSLCGKKQENESKGTVPSADVTCPVEALANSSLEGLANPHVSGICTDVTIPFLGNFRYVVPDSLDDQFEDHIINNVLTSTDNAKAVKSDSQKGERGEASYATVDANERFCCNQTNDGKEFFCEEPEKDFNEQPQKHCVPALNPATGCASTIMLSHTTPLKDDCFTTESGLKPLEISSKRTQIEDAPTCEGLKCIPLSAMQQSTLYDALQDPSLVAPMMEKYSGPLSESIICRNAGGTGLSETFHAAENMVVPDSIDFTSLDVGDKGQTSFDVKGRLGGQKPLLQTEDNREALAPDSSSHVSDDQALSCTFDKTATEFIRGNSGVCVDPGTTGKQHCGYVDHSADQTRGTPADYVPHITECQDDIHKNGAQEQKHNDRTDRAWKLIGCYSHPVQISSVILARKDHEIYLCVSCGLPEERKRELFLYKIDAKEPSLGSPNMFACTSMYLPVLKDEFGREVAVDKTGLQFTPDATGLVIVDSIRTPYCREKNIDCLCPQCESCGFEDNAIKIVQVELGYVSVSLKLKTRHPLHCILVCEPEHVIALDESGIIYIWVMNPTWSVQLEEYVLPSNEFLPSRVVELKKIPKSTSMVLGHNGYGDFSLWDITKRTIVSHFSAPANSVLEFVPVSLFSWQNKSLESHNKPVLDELVKKLMEESMLWFSDHNEESMSGQKEGKKVAVWLLISSSSDSCIQSYPSSCHQNADGCWKLGLLIKNRMILGTAVPSSTIAIGTAAGYGIISSERGHVYTWDLATATKLRTLYDFAAGGGVSHIVADDSTSSSVAIAQDAQLLVYLHT